MVVFWNVDCFLRPQICQSFAYFKLSFTLQDWHFIHSDSELVNKFASASLAVYNGNFFALKFDYNNINRYLNPILSFV